MQPTSQPTEPTQPQDNNWAFRPEDTSATPSSTPQPVTWTASEFIAHHKDGGWYTLVVIGFIILCSAIYLVTKDIISVVAISVVAFLFLIVSSKKPKQQSYTVDDRGISIGQKFYPYSSFKSFALLHEGAFSYISFMPLKRLMPELSIYFAPEDEARIVDVLATNLPNDQTIEKGIDRVMKQLRF